MCEYSAKRMRYPKTNADRQHHPNVVVVYMQPSFQPAVVVYMQPVVSFLKSVYSLLLPLHKVLSSI